MTNQYVYILSNELYVHDVLHIFSFKTPVFNLGTI